MEDTEHHPLNFHSGTSSTTATAAAPPPALLNAVPSFDGCGDGLDWLSSLRRIARLYGWSHDTCLVVAEIKMVGAAQRWVNSRQGFPSWDDFQEQFHQRFGETPETAIARLECCSQMNGEAPQAYADRFLQNAYRAGRAEDGMLLFQFIRGLHPDLMEEAARQRFSSITEVVTFCNYWQSVTGTDYPVDIAVQQYENWAAPSHPSKHGYNFRSRQDVPDNGRPDGQWHIKPPYCNKNDNGRTNTGRSSNENRPWFDHCPPTNHTERPAVNNYIRPVTCQDISDLADKISKLEVKLSLATQVLHKKDRQVRTLRHVLETQPVWAVPNINMLAPADVEDQAPQPDEDLDHDLLQKVLAAIHQVQSAGSVAGRTCKAPHDKASHNPKEPSPDTTAVRPSTCTVAGAQKPTLGASGAAFAKAGTSALGKPTEADMSVPRQHVPFRAQPTPAPNVNALHKAGELGRQLVAGFTRPPKSVVSKEGNMLPYSGLPCAAGHLAYDKQLESKGRDAPARREQVSTVNRRVKSALAAPAASPTPASHNLHTTAEDAAGLHHPMPTFAPESKGQLPLRGNNKLLTAYVQAQQNGQPIRDLVDTGACNNAVSLDSSPGLRSVDQDDLPRPGRAAYKNADGRQTNTLHVLPKLAVGLGDLTTLIEPTVTGANKFDFLLGNDMLEKAKAVIDYNRLKLTKKIDACTEQELELDLCPPDTSAVPVAYMLPPPTEAVKNPSASKAMLLQEHSPRVGPLEPHTAQSGEADLPTSEVRHLQPLPEPMASTSWHESECFATMFPGLSNDDNAALQAAWQDKKDQYIFWELVSALTGQPPEPADQPSWQCCFDETAGSHMACAYLMWAADPPVRVKGTLQDGTPVVQARYMLPVGVSSPIEPHTDGFNAGPEGPPSLMTGDDTSSCLCAPTPSME